MVNIRSELKDPRRFTNNNPKRNMIIDAAVSLDRELLAGILESAIKSGQEKLISIAINLSPSAEVASLINQQLVELFLAQSNRFYIFAIPLLIVADSSADIINQLESDSLMLLLKDYEVLFCKELMLHDLHNLSLCDLYKLQKEQDISKLISWLDSIEQDKIFRHESFSSTLEIRYLLGISAKKDIFNSNIIESRGLQIMNILNSKNLLYIPLLIDSIMGAVNRSRFFFLESIFNIEVSDTVKTIRMSNDSKCYAEIEAINNDHEGIILLRLYKQMLNNLANHKESTLLLKELRWPLTVLDEFNLIADRILGLLSAMQIDTRIISTKTI
jgi:hypothetical protein